MPMGPLTFCAESGFPVLTSDSIFSITAARPRYFGARANTPDQTVDYTLEWGRQVETIQVVLDKELLQATDHAALRAKRNRSALVRDALREHLRRLTIQAMEEQDRAGYLERTAAGKKSGLSRALGSEAERSEDERSEAERGEAEFWEAEAAWPKE